MAIAVCVVAIVITTLGVLAWVFGREDAGTSSRLIQENVGQSFQTFKFEDRGGFPLVNDAGVTSPAGDSGVGWFAAGVKAVPSDAAVVLDTAKVDSPDDFSGVRVFTAAGVALASIETAGTPTALIRKTADELLIADEPAGPFDQFSGATGRLIAYDLADKLSPKWQLGLPGRAGYLLYSSQLMALTGNEQYLAYLTQRWDTSNACRDSRDGDACGLFGVAIVNLVGDPAITEVPLPRECGGARLFTAGPRGVYVTCYSGSQLFLLSADDGRLNPVSLGGPPPAQSRSDRQPSAATPVVGAFTRQDGSIGVLFEDGTLRVLKEGQPARDLPTIPAGAYVVPLGQFEAVDGNILIPYQTPPDNAPAGAALFDLERLSVRWQLADSDDILGVPLQDSARLLIGGAVVSVDQYGPQALFGGLVADSTLVLVR